MFTFSSPIKRSPIMNLLAVGTARFGRFFQLMLDRGIYLAPSQF